MLSVPVASMMKRFIWIVSKHFIVLEVKLIDNIFLSIINIATTNATAADGEMKLC